MEEGLFFALIKVEKEGEKKPEIAIFSMVPAEESISMYRPAALKSMYRAVDNIEFNTTYLEKYLLDDYEKDSKNKTTYACIEATKEALHTLKSLVAPMFHIQRDVLVGLEDIKKETRVLMSSLCSSGKGNGFSPFPYYLWGAALDDGLGDEINEIIHRQYREAEMKFLNTFFGNDKTPVRLLYAGAFNEETRNSPSEEQKQSNQCAEDKVDS